ncbi:MAG TPA: 50S ribosomal protein L22 [Deltaproteobacteria bacterium]|jgi:large subunit ribosomal protein L22|nr:50S ribosomal protein L22 [Deltaproteobacteria bacterium]HPJ95172.1 50S ribosomal protein L22 [Deltaproteobacteria bacterium]HPR53029.1 50S ribosomal protein L22 [Deltaproteobacteria bacterium]
MEAKAILRHTRVSPQKTRLLADKVRNKPIADALRMLNLIGTKRAHIMAKVLNSAVANAMSTGVMDVDNLYVKSILVDEGARLKRWRPRAQGRATRILKRTSHISVVLDEL